MPRSQLTIALESLSGTQCPACQDAKRQNHTLCFNCYRQLPKPNQMALHRGIAQGYQNARAQALALLRARATLAR